MLLWLVLAFMSAAAAALLLRPLLAPAASAPAAGNGSVAVYRDQLAEVDADERRGLIGREEAEAARGEIARRLIAEADRNPPTDGAPASGPQARAGDQGRLAVGAAIGFAALLPVAAVALYLLTGAPGLPSQPIAARRQAPPVSAEMAGLIKAVEARLRQHPEDGRGWDVIAPVYLKLARYREAADAYARASRLLGESVPRLSGFAEALMLAHEGEITAEARSALQTLLKLEPGNARARFWLAFAMEQEGRLADAAAEYGKLLAELPPDTSWRQVLEERHAASRSALATSGPASPGARDGPAAGGSASGPGPTAADIAEAEKLSEGDRKAMIDGMVAGLAARLEKDGRDLAGWQRLIRALTVLGRKDEAVAALGRARTSLADEPQSLAALADLAKSLGLGS